MSHTVLLPEGWNAEGHVEWSAAPTPYPQQKMRIIQVIVLLVMPGAAIAMGILVWRRRRH